jgi:hypothetical protein
VNLYSGRAPWISPGKPEKGRTPDTLLGIGGLTTTALELFVNSKAGFLLELDGCVASKGVVEERERAGEGEEVSGVREKSRCRGEYTCIFARRPKCLDR